MFDGLRYNAECLFRNEQTKKDATNVIYLTILQTKGW